MVSLCCRNIEVSERGMNNCEGADKMLFLKTYVIAVDLKLYVTVQP
jgi:hypothetical protein